MDYFNLFGLLVDYPLDRDELHQTYQALQRQFHPDNFVNKTAQEKNIATKISADITAGYKLLSDPIRRGELVLNLKGFDFSIDTYTYMDADFLMQQVLLREELQDLDSVDYDAFEQKITSAFNALEQEFVDALADSNFDIAAEKLVLMRFYQKVIQEFSLIK